MASTPVSRASRSLKIATSKARWIETGSWPCESDLERSLLGVCLWGKAKDVVGALETEDLGVTAHKEIFEAIACLVEQGETTFDVWTLASELRRRGKLESAGGEAYLADLDRGIVVEQNVGLRAKRLRELAHRRHLLQASEELQRRAADLTEPLIETKAWLSGVLNELS